jgi:hypothetical protein
MGRLLPIRTHPVVQNRKHSTSQQMSDRGLVAVSAERRLMEVLGLGHRT